jgi:hypothetical protein
MDAEFPLYFDIISTRANTLSRISFTINYFAMPLRTLVSLIVLLGRVNNFAISAPRRFHARRASRGDER